MFKESELLFLVSRKIIIFSIAV